MSSLEQALDQHLQLADKTYDEWEEYEDYLEPIKEIELTQGKHTIVDADLFDWLNQWKWCVHLNYAVRSGRYNGRKIIIRMHRVILGLSYLDGQLVDHINRDSLDNRRSNLRVADNFINARNHKLHNTNSSGYNGIGWAKHANKWMAYIDANNKRIYLGYHSDIDDAIIARKMGELKYW